MEDLGNMRIGIGADIDDLLNNMRRGSKSLQDFKDQLERFQQALSKATNPESVIRLNRAIEASQAKIKSIQTAGLDKAFGNIKSSSNTAGFALQNLGRIAQDVPFGFIGIQNNLNPLLESFQRLKAESGSTGGALRALVSSLTGAGGLGLALSLGTAAISFITNGFGAWTRGLGSNKSAIDETAKATKKLADEQKAIVDSVAKEASSIAVIVEQLKGELISRQQRSAAIQELQRVAPAYFGTLDKEKATIEQITKAYNLYAGSITNAIKARVIEKQLEDVVSKRVDLQRKQVDFVKEEVDENGKLIRSTNANYSNQISKETEYQKLASGRGALTKEQKKDLENLLLTEKSLTTELSKIKPVDFKVTTDRNKSTKDIETIQDVLNKLDRQIDVINNNPLIPDTEKAKEKIRDIEAAINTLVNKFKQTSSSPFIIDLQARINDIQLREQFAQVLKGGTEKIQIPFEFQLANQEVAERAAKNFLNQLHKDIKADPLQLGLDINPNINLNDITRKAQEAFLKFNGIFKGLQGKKLIDIEGLTTGNFNKVFNQVANDVDALISKLNSLNTGVNFEGLNENVLKAALGVETILSPAFEAFFETLTSGAGNAFQSFGQALAGMIRQIIVATLKALALGAILSAITGAPFNIGSILSKVFGFAEGGHVKGPGTKTSDSIPAKLSAGEYVIKAKSVDKFGVKFFDELNEGNLNIKKDSQNVILKTLIPKINISIQSDLSKVISHISDKSNTTNKEIRTLKDSKFFYNKIFERSLIKLSEKNSKSDLKTDKGLVSISKYFNKEKSFNKIAESLKVFSSLVNDKKASNSNDRAFNFYKSAIEKAKSAFKQDTTKVFGRWAFDYPTGIKSDRKGIDSRTVRQFVEEKKLQTENLIKNIYDKRTVGFNNRNFNSYKERIDKSQSYFRGISKAGTRKKNKPYFFRDKGLGRFSFLKLNETKAGRVIEGISKTFSFYKSGISKDQLHRSTQFIYKTQKELFQLIRDKTGSKESKLHDVQFLKENSIKSFSNEKTNNKIFTNKEDFKIFKERNANQANNTSRYTERLQLHKGLVYDRKDIRNNSFRSEKQQVSFTKSVFSKENFYRSGFRNKITDLKYSTGKEIFKSLLKTSALTAAFKGMHFLKDHLKTSSEKTNDKIFSSKEIIQVFKDGYSKNKRAEAFKTFNKSQYSDMVQRLFIKEWHSVLSKKTSSVTGLSSKDNGINQVTKKGSYIKNKEVFKNKQSFNKSANNFVSNLSLLTNSVKELFKNTKEKLTNSESLSTKYFSKSDKEKLLNRENSSKVFGIKESNKQYYNLIYKQTVKTGFVKSDKTYLQKISSSGFTKNVSEKFKETNFLSSYLNYNKEKSYFKAFLDSQNKSERVISKLNFLSKDSLLGSNNNVNSKSYKERSTIKNDILKSTSSNLFKENLLRKELFNRLIKNNPLKNQQVIKSYVNLSKNNIKEFIKQVEVNKYPGKESKSLFKNKEVSANFHNEHKSVNSLEKYFNKESKQNNLPNIQKVILKLNHELQDKYKQFSNKESLNKSDLKSFVSKEIYNKASFKTDKLQSSDKSVFNEKTQSKETKRDIYRDAQKFVQLSSAAYKEKEKFLKLSSSQKTFKELFTSKNVQKYFDKSSATQFKSLSNNSIQKYDKSFQERFNIKKYFSKEKNKEFTKSDLIKSLNQELVSKIIYKEKNLIDYLKFSNAKAGHTSFGKVIYTGTPRDNNNTNSKTNNWVKEIKESASQQQRDKIIYKADNFRNKEFNKETRDVFSKDKFVNNNEKYLSKIEKYNSENKGFSKSNIFEAVKIFKDKFNVSNKEKIESQKTFKEKNSTTFYNFFERFQANQFRASEKIKEISKNVFAGLKNIAHEKDSKKSEKIFKEKLSNYVDRSRSESTFNNFKESFKYNEKYIRSKSRTHETNNNKILTLSLKDRFVYKYDIYKEKSNYSISEKFFYNLKTFSDKFKTTSISSDLKNITSVLKDNKSVFYNNESIINTFSKLLDKFTVEKFAGGGFIQGSGSKTSDSILARVSRGEYIVKASSVDKYGVPFLNRINSGTLPNVFNRFLDTKNSIKNYISNVGGSVRNIYNNLPSFASGGLVGNSLSGNPIAIKAGNTNQVFIPNNIIRGKDIVTVYKRASQSLGNNS